MHYATFQSQGLFYCVPLLVQSYSEWYQDYYYYRTAVTNSNRNEQGDAAVILGNPDFLNTQQKLFLFKHSTVYVRTIMLCVQCMYSSIE